MARGNGIYTIPTLCYLKDTTATGSCRMCMVEVEGARTLLPACATVAAPGMVIKTESPRVDASRKMVLELLLGSGNHNCLICEANGECELQALAYRYQVPTPSFANPPDTPYYYEDDNSMIVRDFSKCIMCGRCVRGCNERQVNQAISIGYRGSHNKIVAKADYPYIDSDCVFCGECVQSCPVGALLDKNAMHQGRPWERRTRPHHLPLLRGGLPDRPPRQGRPHRQGHRAPRPCPTKAGCASRAASAWGSCNMPDRLKTPLLRREGGELQEATWDEALDFVAAKPQGIKEKHGPEKIGGWCSARVTNEENYLMQKTAARRRSAPTTWITAPASDTAPPWPVWPRLSVPGR